MDATIAATAVTTDRMTARLLLLVASGAVAVALRRDVAARTAVLA